jgi:hypothetical protein
MKDLLQYFHNAELITTQNADRSLEQYSELLNDLSFLNNCQKFCDDFANDRLASFYVNNISTKKLFNELFDVVKLSLIMSHGNATVESGFSINKQILVENLNEHTLVCQRQVYDAIYSIGGVTNLQINDKIIKYYMSSHRNYKLFRDEEKKKVKSISKEASDKKKARSELYYLENKKKKLQEESQYTLKMLGVEINELRKKI